MATTPDNAIIKMLDPMSEMLGIRHEVTGEGVARSLVVLDHRHENAYGRVHGAIAFTMADVGMGYALGSTLKPGERIASTSLTINYLKAPQGPELVAESRLVNRGRTLATLQTEMHDGGGTLCVLATANFAILGV